MIKRDKHKVIIGIFDAMLHMNSSYRFIVLADSHVLSSIM